MNSERLRLQQLCEKKNTLSAIIGGKLKIAKNDIKS